MITWAHAQVPDSDIQVREDFTHLLFARGYLLSASPHTVPVGHWAHRTFDGWHLSWDPRLAVSAATEGSRTVVVLGTAIDLRSGDVGDVVTRTILGGWTSSRAHLDETLEWLAGRYVVLALSPVEGFLQTDATGMLSAFYSPEHRTVSSHQNLLAEAVGGLDRTPFAEPGWIGAHHAITLPGLASNWEGVRPLTANTELDLASFGVRRVGPRAPDRLGPKEAAEQVLGLMRRQLVHLGRPGGGPMVSLTAGLDSRITLAVMRDLAPETLCFTYDVAWAARASTRVDLQVATQLARDLGLEHRALAITEPLPADDPLYRVLARTNSVSHNRSIAAAYVRHLPGDRLHVRSNLYEIGRGYYLRDYRPRGNARGFAHLLTKGSDPAVVEAFEEMVATTGITQVPGYDPLDLFYWEFRMVKWFNQVLLESDLAHDTHILVNSRAILRLLLSVREGQRVRAEVFDHIVEMAWPEVFNVPVNGEQRPRDNSWTPRRVRSTLERTARRKVRGLVVDVREFRDRNRRNPSP